ncbi:MAG TPA: helix-turn-helix domain-containing protein [Candidatus Nanoarchaeia archaeon]|nr:helix-turn-helix domain-containing protein [Candidatus Nanoarchaeia archaeon]
MKQPQEIEVWYILPSLRKEIAKELVRLGMKQKEVASLLDITEAAISQYFKSKRAKDIPLTKKIKDKIKISAKRIYHNKESFTKELQDLCKLVKEENILCQIHKKYDKISAKCNICFRDIPLNLKPIKQNKSHHDCPICNTLYKTKLTNCPKCGFITGSKI